LKRGSLTSEINQYNRPLNPLKKLVSQTAIYGLSSIVGRFLNYLLTPIYTNPKIFSEDQYGIITEMYTYVAFLIILLTYGMETAFFRFSSQRANEKKSIYSTAIFSLATTTFLFVFIALVFAQPIADSLKYSTHKEYVIWFALIVSLDAFSTIPMAKLRLENKALKFAAISLINVAVNIALNIFFLFYCPYVMKSGGNFLTDLFYNPEIGVGYVFISNLVASVVKFTMLIPQIIKVEKVFKAKILKAMLIYAYPMLFVGLSGRINETIDRILLKGMLFSEKGEVETMSLLGVYGANYKLAVLIYLFINAFQYAAEPFFFNQEKNKDAKETYAKVMTYFVIVVSGIFLMVTLYLSYFKYFIGEPYWEGLKIVPILLFSYVCWGVYYNLSVWYKLSSKTSYGAIISFTGAIITILINVLFIPKYGYMASAWATVICYAIMVLMSFFMGLKYYPIPYDISKTLMYLGLALTLFFVSSDIDYQHPATWSQIAYNTLLFICYIAFVYVLERPKKNINLAYSN